MREGGREGGYSRHEQGGSRPLLPSQDRWATRSGPRAPQHPCPLLHTSAPYSTATCTVRQKRDISRWAGLPTSIPRHGVGLGRPAVYPHDGVQRQVLADERMAQARAKQQCCGKNKDTCRRRCSAQHNIVDRLVNSEGGCLVRGFLAS
jgi:hypothetical protein